MACHQLVQHVQASAAYLKSLPSSTQTYQVLENQCKAAKNLIAKIQGPVEALHVAQAVQEHWGGLLSDEQMYSLISLLNDAACKTPLQEMQLQLQQAGSRGNASQQHWESSFWKDIPKSLYDGLGDKRIQSTMRMADLFQYLASIGLRAPSENTVKAMLSLYFYVDSCPVGADATMLYTAVQHVKTSWKSFIHDYKQRQGADAAVHHAFPGPPAGVTCVRLDFVKFMSIYNQIPVRSTNAALNRLGMVQPALNRLGRQCIERARSLQLLPCTGQNALTDFDAGMGPTVPMLALPAPADGQMHELQITTVSANTAAAPAADGAALQLSRPLDAGQARKSLAEVTAQLQQVQKDKQQQQAAAAAPMKKKKKKDTKKKKGSKGKSGKSKKKKAAGIPRSPKSSRNRAILKSKNKGTKKKRSGGDELCTCKECGGVDGLVLEDGGCATICVWCIDKQKAAKAASKPGPVATKVSPAAKDKVFKKPAFAIKKPAIAKRKVQRPSTRLPSDASLEQKNAFYMSYGCSKCRWSPGCTNSCWRDRGMSKPAPAEGEDVH